MKILPVRFFLYSFFLLLCGGGATTVVAQNPDSLQLIRHWDLEAEDFYVDAFENIYFKDDENTLRKLEISGSSRFEFMDQRLGTLDRVDLSDPLDVILFYPEFQQLVVLDRTLSETGRINMNALGFFGIEAIGYSTDNKIWLYDPMTGTLKKVDFGGGLHVESQILPPLIGIQLNPISIVEQDQKVYLQCSDAGVLVFDVFGKFLEQIPWEKGRDLQVGKQIFFGCKGRSCLFLDAFSQSEWKFELPERAKKVVFRAGKLYVLTENGLNLYQLRKSQKKETPGQ